MWFGQKVYNVNSTVCSQTGQEHELIESMPLLEWFANNYKRFGATLEIVNRQKPGGFTVCEGLWRHWW